MNQRKNLMTNLNRTTAIFIVLLACSASQLFEAAASPAGRGLAALKENCLDDIASFLDARDRNNLAKTSKSSFKTLTEQPLLETMAKIRLPLTVSETRWNGSVTNRSMTLPLAQKSRVLVARAILCDALQPDEIEKKGDGTYLLPNKTMQKVLLALGGGKSLQTGVAESNAFVVIKSLASRADPNQIIAISRAPLLHYAYGKQHTGIIKLLLSHGANPNAALYGTTCLHVAAENSNVESARLLLDHPAFNAINAQTDLGRTALHLACYTGQTAMVKILLSHGASKDVRDNMGLTPLAVARRLEESDCIKLLTGHTTRCRAERRTGSQASTAQG